MANYFDEHNCEPLGENEQPNHQLHLASYQGNKISSCYSHSIAYWQSLLDLDPPKRLLIDTGAAAQMAEEFGRLFDRQVPPASTQFIADLPTSCLTENNPKIGSQCVICLGVYVKGEETKELPCTHSFHSTCILPWLMKVNTCPLCRVEFPTDDEEYEAIRKHKARQKQREFEIETLHDSMFG